MLRKELPLDRLDHGAGGLDELSTCGHSKVSEWRAGTVHTFYVHPSDVGLTRVAPQALAGGSAEENAALIALIKPQFEAGPARVRKGVVRDEAVHAEVCRDIGGFVEGLGWRVCGLSASPIEGGDGNREFLLGATRGAPA